MSILLATLVSRVTAAVPAVNGVPSSYQAMQLVLDAVVDFSSKCTRPKSAEIAVVAGTATYALPADFVRLIELVPLAFHRPNLAITPQGLVPFTLASIEEVSLEGDHLRITPTPGYSVTRRLRYGAGHVVTGTAGSEVFAELTEREARIILLCAQSDAYQQQARQADQAGALTDVSIGDVSVKVKGPSASAASQATALRADYERAVEKFIGTLTIPGRQYSTFSRWR